MIAVCNLGKQQLIRNGWSGDRISVIFNAVDPAAWAGDRSESTLRQELGIPEDRFVMLCASRFADDKGHHYLLESVKRLREISDVPFTLVLAGDGPLLEERKAQARELGLEDCVKFIGFRKDIKNLYKASDLYVNSSRHEALSFLIIEAMAAGLPVVVTDIAGNPDIVNDQTNCGLLAEYDNPDSMAGALKRMMESRSCWRAAVPTPSRRWTTALRSTRWRRPPSASTRRRPRGNPAALSQLFHKIGAYVYVCRTKQCPGPLFCRPVGRPQ